MDITYNKHTKRVSIPIRKKQAQHLNIQQAYIFGGSIHYTIEEAEMIANELLNLCQDIREEKDNV